MPNLLLDLVVDRVDLVNEGANSAAFIELYKRKEQCDMDVNEILSKLKPEHAEVIKSAIDKAENAAKDTQKALDDANEVIKSKDEELQTANDTIETLKAKGNDGDCECDGEANEEGVCKVCGKPKKSKAGVNSLDEAEVLKSIPEGARELFAKMKADKEAAEEIVRKNAEEKANEEAAAKAANLKALPVEQDKLVEVLKSASTELVDMLTAINTAIEGTVLDEVGKSAGNGASQSSTDAWGKIEAAADEIAKRDNVTKSKAISIALDENPELYREYVNGGAK